MRGGRMFFRVSNLQRKIGLCCDTETNFFRLALKPGFQAHKSWHETCYIYLSVTVAQPAMEQ